MTSGILVVDKPEGPTSHDVVAKLRKVFGTRQVGHAGTLDPMATGVLVVAIGEATKLVPWLTSDDKAYETTMRLGIGTDTLDAQGKATEHVAPSDAVREALRAAANGDETGPLAAALAAERTRTMQVPPAYSAIKIDGRRAHAMARAGETPDLPPREVQVRSILIAGATDDPLDLRLDVGKGYFVRALARDLAASLGTVAHLVRLRRTRSGAFGLEEAVTLDAPAEVLRSKLVPLATAAARALPSSILTEAGVRAATFGQRIAPTDIRDPHARASAWLDEGGRLVAIGEAEADGSGKVLRGFPA